MNTLTIEERMTMKINLILFVASVNEQEGDTIAEPFIKTVESTIRPVNGDIIEDPGFHPGYHNGYEVVKVTVNYELNECWVSLSPLEVDTFEIKTKTYIERLKANGWSVVSKKSKENI